jgi:molybdopterin-binding protein
MRLGEAADRLGVSVDTVRRWADAGTLGSSRTDGGQREVDDIDVARLVSERAVAAPATSFVGQSARNRFDGIVTRVVKDKVMAQVEIQAGPFRVVSLMSREACDELGLRPGVVASAAVKATNVVVEVPE